MNAGMNGRMFMSRNEFMCEFPHLWAGLVSSAGVQSQTQMALVPGPVARQNQTRKKDPWTLKRTSL